MRELFEGIEAYRTLIRYIDPNGHKVHEETREFAVNNAPPYYIPPGQLIIDYIEENYDIKNIKVINANTLGEDVLYDYEIEVILKNSLNDLKFIPLGLEKTFKKEEPK
jgi:hypothetical protein